MTDIRYCIYEERKYLVKRATFSIAAGANATVVAAVAGKKIVVVGCWITVDSTSIGVVTFRSTTATAITPAMDILPYGPVLLPTGSMVICETVAGELLDVAVTTQAARGIIQYIEV